MQFFRVFFKEFSVWEKAEYSVNISHRVDGNFEKKFNEKGEILYAATPIPSRGYFKKLINATRSSYPAKTLASKLQLKCADYEARFEIQCACISRPNCKNNTGI